jgi:hypothetical protein
MKVPTCSCMMIEFERKYKNNPKYGKPETITISRQDQAKVSCNNGKYGTVMMKQNYCAVCGKAYKEITI